MTLLLLMAMLAGAPEDIFKEHCSVCHEAAAASRAPRLPVLRQMAPENIVAALETGLMQTQGRALAAADRKAVAQWLTGKTLGTAMASTGFCANRNPAFDPAVGRSWNGWGNGAENARFTSEDLDASKLELKWAFGFAGVTASFAQPAIVGDRIFIGGAARKVYSLDAKTGCIHWIFEPQANVRAAITIAQPHTALVADQGGNVYGLDARNGEMQWKTNVDEHASSHITGAPALHGKLLYVPISSGEDGPSLNPKYECCTGRGGVAAVNIETGKLVWKTFSIAEAARPTTKNTAGTQMWGPSGASIWLSPTIDAKRGLLYVGTGDNHSAPETNTSDAVMALRLDNGEIAWTRQLTEHDKFNIACVAVNQANCPEGSGPDLDIGASPIIVGSRLIVGQKSAVVHALDLDHKGAILWQTRVGKGGPLGGIQWGMASDGTKVYVALSDVAFASGGIFGKPGKWQLDPKVGGGLFALDIVSGRKVWSASPPDCAERVNCSPAQSAAITATPSAVYAGGVDGRIRAYSTRDGHVLWEYDTAREFATVNGVAAKGGAMDGPGPVVWNGMLYVPSGYGNWGGVAGNVLLAFGAR